MISSSVRSGSSTSSSLSPCVFHNSDCRPAAYCIAATSASASSKVGNSATMESTPSSLIGRLVAGPSATTAKRPTVPTSCCADSDGGQELNFRQVDDEAGRGVGKCLLDGFRQLRRGEHVDTPRTESTAARADQSVSMLNPLLAAVDAESGIWVECVAMVMSRAVNTYALRRGCVSNSPSPGVWVPRIAVRHPLRGRTERAVAQARRRQRPGPATASHIGGPNLLAHRENRRNCATPASPNWQSLGCSFDSCPGA